MYYKKLINQKKLIKLWANFRNNIKNIFEINYQILTFFYNNNCFVDYKKLILGIKRILPIVINSNDSSNIFFFILTEGFYNQTISNRYYSNFKKFQSNKLGVCTNFSIINYNLSNKLDYKINPCFLFLFYATENYSIVIEGKKKGIILISLSDSEINSNLIDYPIFLNSLYFYSIYFFNLFLLRLILIKK